MTEKVLNNMRRLCSRREYCVSDIRNKLMAQLEGNTVKVQEILDSLQKDKYLDDMRYAVCYARDKSSIAGWGETKIRYMLSSKGISREVIAKAIEEIDQSRAKIRLDKLLENKYRILKDDPQCKIKLLRFALGRGYSYEDSAQIINGLMEDTDR